MKTLCPICSDILLPHLYQNNIFWFCLRCRQEMPNFDLFKLNAIQKNFLKFGNNLNSHQHTCFKNPSPSNSKSIVNKSMIVDLLINDDQQRLEVVSFILRKINLVAVNTFVDTKQNTSSRKSQSNQLKAQKVKTNKLTKTDFLRDSEIILLYICQAILISDSSILNSENLKSLKANYVKLKFPVEQISCLIDIIKTSVIDFIHSITSDSSQNVHCFISEVASYFEMVITLLIKLEQPELD